MSLLTVCLQNTGQRFPPYTSHALFWTTNRHDEREVTSLMLQGLSNDACDYLQCVCAMELASGYHGQDLLAISKAWIQQKVELFVLQDGRPTGRLDRQTCLLASTACTGSTDT